MLDVSRNSREAVVIGGAGGFHRPLNDPMRAAILIFPSCRSCSCRYSRDALAQSGGMFGPRVLGNTVRPGVSQFDGGLQLAPSGAFVGAGRPNGANMFARPWRACSGSAPLRSVRLCRVVQRPACGNPLQRNHAGRSRGAGNRCTTTGGRAGDGRPAGGVAARRCRFPPDSPRRYPRLRPRRNEPYRFVLPQPRQRASLLVPWPITRRCRLFLPRNRARLRALVS